MDSEMEESRAVRNGDKSFSKLFEIVELIGSSRDGLRGREIAAGTGIPASTTFRMLKFMVDRGYLRNRGNCYTLGPGFMRLGDIAAGQNPLLVAARPFLTELSGKTLETVHLAGLRGDMVCYFDKVEGVRSVRMGSLIGSLSPVYCTGVGKAMLAFMPENTVNELLERIEFKARTSNTLRSADELRRELAEVRLRGFAVDDCEHEPGVYCVAAPIFDYAGNVIAGISISGSEFYLRSRSVELAGLVRETARKISAAYSGR